MWESVHIATTEELMSLLRDRFGSDSQTQRFRIELQVRQWQKNESQETVFLDVKRLIALAFPGELA